MENATNALLIAAAVLIAIIILSLGISLYTVFSRQSDEFSKTISDTEILKFNSNFEVYIGRTDIKAQEFVTIVNLSREKFKTVKVFLKTENLTDKTNFSSEEFISENKNETFSCVYTKAAGKANPSYDETGKIKRIIFIKNT